MWSCRVWCGHGRTVCVLYGVNLYVGMCGMCGMACKIYGVHYGVCMCGM